jgi:hypothetical protein
MKLRPASRSGRRSPGPSSLLSRIRPAGPGTPQHRKSFEAAVYVVWRQSGVWLAVPVARSIPIHPGHE